MSLRKRGMINTGNFDTKSKGKRTKVQEATQGELAPVAPKTRMTKKGCILVGLPVKGVISGSVGK